MQFDPSQPSQQGQFGPNSEYPNGQYGQPHPQQPPYYPPQQQQQAWQPPSQPQQQQPWQPPEGTWQPPSQPYPQQQQQVWQPQQQQPYPQYPPQQWQQQPPQGYPGQQMYAPQMQQPMQPYPPGQPVMMPQQVVNVNIQQRQHGLFVRALYFLFIGYWAGFIWLNIGYGLVLSVIGLPLGLMMLNRLPMVMTLKPASQSVNISITGNTTNINIGGAQQVNFLLRALYFVFIGWWAGLMWSYVAYVMFVLIVTIPVGVMMFNMLPTIITLRKN